MLLSDNLGTITLQNKQTNILLSDNLGTITLQNKQTKMLLWDNLGTITLQNKQTNIGYLNHDEPGDFHRAKFTND